MKDTALGREREAWIALASTPGVGDVTFQRLLATYGSATATLAAVTKTPLARTEAQLARRLGLRLRPGLTAALRRTAADPGLTQRRMTGLGGWVLTPLDVGYPASLHELEEPPAVVFGLGSPSSLGAAGTWPWWGHADRRVWRGTSRRESQHVSRRQTPA